MAVLKIIITNKKTFDVIQREDIIAVRVEEPWWYVKKTDLTEVPYTLSDFNIRILGVIR